MIKKIVLFSLFIVLVLLNSFIYSQNIPETFNNPIMRGFHPDPSICRVGNNYYLVNSTFEWFPGVPIHQSKDLVNWELIGYVLNRPSQLNMKDNMRSSEGIWAPTIRYHNGTYYVITTCQNCGGNFYVTATNPKGPWSDPVFLDNAPGIDPSLFWDNDGSCWYTGSSCIAGPERWPDERRIWLQQLDLKNGKLFGPKYILTSGHASNARWAEGPHIYKINDRYMLMVAEGGSGLHSAVTVFESNTISGPYTPSYINPVLTHRHLGIDYPIKVVGHADIVQTQKGELWGVMQGVRPIKGYIILGRETFLTPFKFECGWPVFNPGEGKVLSTEKRPDLPWTPVPNSVNRDSFEYEELNLYWNFLRTPYEKWYSLTTKSGYLKLKLRPQTSKELTNPSLIARRIQHNNFQTLTKINFKPTNFNEEAGLIVIQNERFHYRLVIKKKEKGNIVILYKVEQGKELEIKSAAIVDNEIILGLKKNGLSMDFIYGTSSNKLNILANNQDATVVSTNKAGGFTGPYIGMYASCNGKVSKNAAYFDWFEYKEMEVQDIHNHD